MYAIRSYYGEVLDLSPITKVPKAPRFMRGVINVRGSVVPVVDLRLKFGMPEIKNTLDTRIVVMELSLDSDTVVVGAIADSVHEVMELEPGHIEPVITSYSIHYTKLYDSNESARLERGS